MLGELLTKEFVGVSFGKFVMLLESEVIELHEFHAWEWVDIEVCDTSSKLQRPIMLHVLFVIEHAVPYREGRLFFAQVLINTGGVEFVRVHEPSSVLTHGESSGSKDILLLNLTKLVSQDSR